MWKKVKWLLTVLFGFLLGSATTLVAISMGWVAPDILPNAAAEWGKFPTTANVEFLDDGRQLKLIEDFAYVDPRGRMWTADKGTVVNGASIPQAFWSIVGGPLEGQYRNASIIHDEACARRTESWENVHYMFYEACRCGGLSEYKSKILYAAVYHFGPRWTNKAVAEEHVEIGPDGEQRIVAAMRLLPENILAPEPTPEMQKKLENFIKEKNPSLKELEVLDLGLGPRRETPPPVDEAEGPGSLDGMEEVEL